MTTTRTDLATRLAARHDIDQAAAAEAVEVYAEQLGAAPGDLADTEAEAVDLALQAHLAHDVGAPLDVVADATGELAALRQATEAAEEAWKASIRAAVADGQRVVDIAEAAGISRERVYQIRDGRR